MTFPNRIAVFIGLLCCVVWSVMMTTPLIVLGKLIPKICSHIQRWFGKGCCFFLGIKVTILHTERISKVGGNVIAPNHASMYDICVLASLPIYFRWISKAQVGKIPFIGCAMRSLGAYFLQRGGSPGDVSIMKRVEQGLRDGFSVLIFPEGTRSPDGFLLPFKKGAVRTAQNANALIIPIGLCGTWQIAPKGRLPLKRGHQVVVNFGIPIRVTEAEAINGALIGLKCEIQKLIDEARGVFSESK